jgi:hypothetical protein
LISVLIGSTFVTRTDGQIAELVDHQIVDTISNYRYIAGRPPAVMYGLTAPDYIFGAGESVFVFE